jgi:hypothetical protein
MNTLLTGGLFKLTLTVEGKRLYAKASKNILGGQYPKKKRDGRPYEYNESVTVVPKEFESQGTDICACISTF